MKTFSRLALFALAFVVSLACRAIGFSGAGDSLLSAAVRYCFRRGPTPVPLPAPVLTESLARIEARIEDLHLPLAEEVTLPPPMPLLPADQSNGVLAVSPDGKLIVCGSPYDGKVRVFDAVTKKELRRLPGHADWVTSVVVSADSRTATTSSRDGTVKTWILATGREVRSTHGASRR